MGPTTPGEPPSGSSAGISRQSIAVIAGILLAALIAGFVAVGPDDRQRPAQARGLRGNQLPSDLDRSPAPEFRLEDARGGVVSTRALRGRPYALTFLYTQCPDVCPIIGQELKSALGRLGKSADRVAVVAISVDPRGDTPAAVRRWLRRQQLPSNFRYAVGSRAELAPVWKAYFAAPQIEGRPETSTHSAAVWIVDGRGRLRTRYSAGAPFDPGDVAADLRVLMSEAQRE